MAVDYPGVFVTLEGIDGAGKSTVAETLDTLYGHHAVLTQEPSTYWSGEALRDVLSGKETSNPVTTFQLFMADRALHIEDLIKPALEEGMLVVSDRYADSTRAYQPHALRKHVKDPHGYIDTVMAPWNLEPDLTLLLDISVDTALERCEGSDEYENRAFLEAVHANYAALAEVYPERIVVIDAERPLPQVMEEVLSAVTDIFP